MPRTKRLAEYINGNIHGGEIKFHTANRVSDGIKVQYEIVPDDSEAFEASQIVGLDFDLRELATIVRQKAEQQLAEVGQ